MKETKTPWNPSRRAIARVKNPCPTPTICNCCNSLNISIVNHEQIYGKSYSEWPWCYLCDDCGAYVGMHPFTNIPLGTLADLTTRRARTACKPAFEKLWRSPSAKFTRGEAYTWLAMKLNITGSECHFGIFSAELCQMAKSICDEENNNGK